MTAITAVQYTYEGECTKADAEETLSNCDQTECARVRFLFWTVPVQCWTESSCWANQFAALESYDMYANMTSEYNANSLFTTGSTTVRTICSFHVPPFLF